MNCNSCKYSGMQMNPNHTSGLICRRYPPKAHSIPVPTNEGLSIRFINSYPVVTESDYCYEFNDANSKLPSKLLSS